MTKDGTKFIIGAGISGLIYAFYNRDYTVLSPDIGGKLKNNYLSSTILLHDTPATRRLLQDLKISPEPKAQVMRYCYRGQLQESIPVNLRELMVTKKLTPWKRLDKLDYGFEITDTTLSTKDVYIPIFKVSLEQVIDALSRKVKFVEDTALRITETEIITEKGRYCYTDLISTIPAPNFWRLYGNERVLKCLPETFVLTKQQPNLRSNLYWDLIYFLDRDVPYTRISKHSDDTYLYELTGGIDKADLKTLFGDIRPEYVYTDPYGIVITDLNNIPPPNVRFVGRFATWNHATKIQDVVREAVARYDFTSVWNKQKDFNLNFFDFNIHDIELQQKLTKDFVLHIEDEAHELLQQINWKMGEYKVADVDRARLLEEWIDVFKYWLGIGQVWGFNIEDMFNEFWRKSAVVDERFKKYIHPSRKAMSKVQSKGKQHASLK